MAAKKQSVTSNKRRSSKKRATARRLPTQAAVVQPAPRDKPSGIRRLFSGLGGIIRPKSVPVRPLAPSRTLLHRTGVRMWQHKRLFVGVLLVYGLAELVLVYRGTIVPNFSLISDALRSSLSGFSEQLYSSGSLFIYLALGSNQVGAEGGVYQSLLFVVGSLAIIWTLRQVYIQKRMRVRDAYYKGMTPLIPFILVLIIMAVQCLPLLIGVSLFQLVVLRGVAVGLVENGAFTLISFLIAVPSLYMIVATIMALYIVTLPNMTPLRSLRSAKKIVQYRRLAIWWRLLVLAFVSGLLLVVVVVPVIYGVPKAAPLVFYSCTVLLLGFAHAYLYGLYRELLQDA